MNEKHRTALEGQPLRKDAVRQNVNRSSAFRITVMHCSGRAFVSRSCCGANMLRRSSLPRSCLLPIRPARFFVPRRRSGKKAGFLCSM